jgi:hypothetical protein
MFDLDDVGKDVLDLFKSKNNVTANDVQAAFSGQYSVDSLIETLEDFQELDIISSRAHTGPANPGALAIMGIDD